MKNFRSCFIITAIVVSFGFINPGSNASQKVLDAFNRGFTNAKNVKWFSINNEYTAVFFENEIRTSITYDKNGGFLSSPRSYKEDGLPFNVLVKIKEKYKGKTIKTVTEVMQESIITYSVVMEDEENTYVIESSSNTNISVQTKFKRQEP